MLVLEDQVGEAGRVDGWMGGQAGRRAGSSLLLGKNVEEGTRQLLTAL